MSVSKISLVAVLFAAVPLIAGAQTTALAGFGQDLFFGMRGNADVSRLQQFLGNQGFLDQAPTGNFLTLTRAAVKKFQQKYSINSTGYFGPLSRVAANKIVGSTTPPADTSGSPLTIDPATVTVKVGEKKLVRAIFTPPAPGCLQAHPPCTMPVQAPHEVTALFSSENQNIVAVDNEVEGHDRVYIRGISPGTATVHVSYIPYPNAYIASMKVTVVASATQQ